MASGGWGQPRGVCVSLTAGTHRLCGQNLRVAPENRLKFSVASHPPTARKSDILWFTRAVMIVTYCQTTSCNCRGPGGILGDLGNLAKFDLTLRGCMLYIVGLRRACKGCRLSAL